MATCEFCDQEMHEAESCTKNMILYPDGTIQNGGRFEPAIPYGEENRWDLIDDELGGPDARCHDCGVRLGAFHHPGCDIEESPATGHQLLAELLRVEDRSARPLHAEAGSDPHHQIDISDVIGATDDRE